MELVHRDDLKRGGFAGLRETRMVMDPQAWGSRQEPGSFSGVGNFVYLADARFMPHGSTGMHPHKEVDVISIMMEGRINHEGSLEHGQQLLPYDIQVQRAGGEGFVHNEVNPDEVDNRMLQLWVLPEVSGQPAGYRVYHADPGQRVSIYGGPDTQSECFPARTIMEVVRLDTDGQLNHETPCMVYVATGFGDANGSAVREGHLLRDDSLEFKASEESTLILIYTAN
jgi:redox-sensitive bicupin YhaK (pirin superfamily)